MTEKLVTRIEFGSHLYGTNTPSSDRDYKSVYIPSASDILLQRVKGSLGHKVKRFEGDKNSPEDTDDESYSLQRYLGLLAEGQTVAIDMLFAPKPLVTSDLWNEIKANKDLLLTKKAASFVGYCRTQANKYGIKGSRVAAAKRVMELLRREYDLRGSTAKMFEIEDMFPLVMDEHTSVVEIKNLDVTEKYLECCNRKIGFKNTIKEGYNVMSRIYENYGKRAKMAENNEGVDWKALSHAVRVGNEAVELLSTGNITFPLFNREHILDIKLGRLSYEVVASEIEDLLFMVDKTSIESDLRDEPDYVFIDSLVYKVYGQSVVDGLVDDVINYHNKGRYDEKEN